MATVEITWNPCNAENLSELMRKVGEEWRERIVEYFKQGGPEEARWEKTQKPQKAAILKKLDKEGSGINIASLNKYFDTNKMPLMGPDSGGTLRDSFTYNVSKSGNQVTLQVGTNIEYAEKHHKGEMQTIPITQSMRDGINRILKSRSKQKGRLRFLKSFMEVNEYRFQLKKRVLIFWDSYLRSRINKIFSDWITEMNKQSKLKG
jgi:phage gpG-like protein